MNELDDQGILTKEAWENIISGLPEGNTCKQCRVAILTAQRDALLDLLLKWIDDADSINKRKHYGDGGQEGINYLYGQVGKFRTKGKPPGWPQHQGATNQIVRSLR